MKERFYWSDEKIEELKSLWGTSSISALATHFHTTPETIKKKKEELGLGEAKSNRWTKEEEQLLIEYSKKYITKTIAKKLGRSVLAVQKKAIKMGIELHGEKDPWKKWMIDYLRDNINKKPIGEIVDMLGISYRRILTKCSELGIEYQKESWTEDEIRILREYAPKCHYTELVKVLPRRSVGAISAKAYELGIETISDYVKLNEETAKYIKDNWGKIQITEMARTLGVSTGIIYRYKRELNLPNVNQDITKKWTDKKVAKLRVDAKRFTREELAKKYKTSPGQISTIAARYNIELSDAKKIWTAELDSKLLKLVAEDKSIAEISSIMKMKGSSIRERLEYLKGEIKKPSSRKRWSKKEENILRNMSSAHTVKEIAETLSLSEQQVYHKALRLGIKVNSGKNKNWTDEETLKLKELSSDYTLAEISNMLSRSEEVVSKKAKELGITLKTNRTRWTKEELEKLRELAKRMTAKEIAKELKRSVASTSSKLRELGITPKSSDYHWTEEEEETLRILSETLSVDEIAQKMNKTRESILNKLYKLGIRAVSKNKKTWTKEEEQELEELLTTYSTFEVAELLGRSEEAISIRANKLGIKIDTKNRRWTKEEEEKLSDLWGQESIDSIAKKLDRTPSAIQNRVYILGLGSQIDNNYDGIRIQELADIFKVGRTTILTTWVNLGLKLSFRKRSNNNIYSFVKIENLYAFLEANQNIWDSRVLEKNIFGVEPEWLEEKRKKDRSGESPVERTTTLKQQRINEKSYYLEESTNFVEKEKVYEKK